MPRSSLYVFDFDGTLTHGDTFLPFARSVVGWRRVSLVLLRFLPQLIGMKLRLCDNGGLKERVVGALFAGRTAEEMDAAAQRFAQQSDTLWRSAARSELDRLTQQGERVVVVTASLSCWVRPIVHRHYPQAVIIATEHAVDDEDRWTGAFSTPNCYGEEKVRRLKEVFPDIEQYHVVAYGDSRGDSNLISYADEAHYQSF